MINPTRVVFLKLFHGTHLLRCRSSFLAMSASSTSSGMNPFVAAAAVAITAATAQLINIKSHVPVTLDLGDSNFGTWRTFFLM